MALNQKHCVPCEGGVPPLLPDEIRKFRAETPEWEVSSDYKKIIRNFTLENFRKAMEFVNAVAALAESEGHHPDIEISYNKVKLILWTHAVGGLSENDFIVAAKINELK